MSHELFHDVTDTRPRAGRAAGGTLAVSIVAHALVLAAVIVVPLLAKDALPDLPWNESVPVSVRDVMPPPPAPAPPIDRTRSTTPQPTQNAAPVEPQDGIRDEVEHPLTTNFTVGVDPATFDGVPDGLVGGTGDAVPQPPTPPPPAPQKPVRVTSINMPAKIHDLAPIYPAIAQKANIEGIVIIEAVIAVDGSVRDARVLKSVALLDRAALDAVKQWRYAPTRLNGVAVPVIVTVTVQFRLQR
ncbi:MAG: energy transducer TonB [Vicinamibacteraceae bacterium]